MNLPFHYNSTKKQRVENTGYSQPLDEGQDLSQTSKGKEHARGGAKAHRL